jgi:hypothetical protein
MTALLLVTLLSVTALAVDAGFIFDYRLKMGAASDAAARQAALEIRRDASLAAPANASRLTAFARNAAALNGFADGVDGIVVTARTPPQAPSSFSGMTGYVEVLVSQVKPTFFMRVLGQATMAVATRATAGYGSSAVCITALAPSGNGLFIVGNGSVTAPGCTVNVKSNANVTAATSIDLVGPYGSGAINIGGTVTPVASYAASKMEPDGNLCGPTCAAQIVDPLDSLPTPTNPGGCTTLNFTAGSHIVVPGCYDSISISGGMTVVDFQGIAGQVYYIATGNVTIANATVTGTNVTMYLAAASARSLLVSGSIALSAPATGSYPGILFYQNRTSTAMFSQFTGGGTMTLTGTLYFKNTEVDYTGNPTLPADYTFIVAKTIKIAGGSNLANNMPFMPGNALSGASAAIVE